MSFYGDEQRALQARFDTSNLAAVFEATIVTDSINDEQKTFIEGRDHFFLSSVNADGWPTVSYKGGEPVDRGGGNFGAVATEVGEPDVVEQDDQHIGLESGRGRRGRPMRCGIRHCRPDFSPEVAHGQHRKRYRL